MAELVETEGQSDGPVEPAMERAEQLVDDLGRRIGHVTARFVARAREELEDIWAEAQSIREEARRQ